jgi:hypothetical protein
MEPKACHSAYITKDMGEIPVLHCLLVLIIPDEQASKLLNGVFILSSLLAFTNFFV